MRLVQQIVHSFFIDLKVGAVYRELFMARATLLLYHLKQEPDRPRHNTLVLAGLHHGHRLPLVILAVLVPLHTERLARTRLPIGKNGRIVALITSTVLMGTIFKLTLTTCLMRLGTPHSAKIWPWLASWSNRISKAAFL